ncbi:MAG: hypothetical protein FD138_3902 [Planctomycetota bacterium]|nr:MAG: hypothetical protein FD138_3902 [Planctomycetota bacterium]
MATSKAHPRKRLFVNRDIQGRLLARTGLYWVLYHAVLWMAMFFIRYAEHRGAIMAGAEPRSFGDLYGEFVHENSSLWVCAFAILPIVLWDLLKFSHRVAGPLVRFQRVLESLTAGQTVNEVRLRRGDLLFDLEIAFNQYLASLRNLQSDSELAIEPNGSSESAPADELIESQLADELQQIQAEVQAVCAPSSATATPQPTR